MFKSLNYDDFVTRAMRLEVWCQDPETKSPLLDVLRDVIELKRVNNGLMKATLIDDLVGDTYAMMYATVGPMLDTQPLPASAQQQAPKPAGAGPAVDGAADAPPYQPFVAQEGPGRPRTKGVGRRELQRRAEAAVTPPIRPPTTTSMPVRQSSVQVVISSSAEPAVKGTAGTATAQSSVPGSVHDSADDESGSELSELEEEPEPPEPEKSMFPNLRRASLAGEVKEEGKKEGDADVEMKEAS